MATTLRGLMAAAHTLSSLGPEVRFSFSPPTNSNQTKSIQRHHPIRTTQCGKSISAPAALWGAVFLTLQPWRRALSFPVSLPARENIFP